MRHALGSNFLTGEIDREMRLIFSRGTGWLGYRNRSTNATTFFFFEPSDGSARVPPVDRNRSANATTFFFFESSDGSGRSPLVGQNQSHFSIDFFPRYRLAGTLLPYIFLT